MHIINLNGIRQCLVVFDSLKLHNDNGYFISNFIEADSSILIINMPIPFLKNKRSELLQS